MSTEITVTIALAAISGLCFLMWTTDGQLDWLAELGSVIAALLGMLGAAYNFGCELALETAVDALIDKDYSQQHRLRAAFSAAQLNWTFFIAAWGTTVGLRLLPPLFTRIRASKRVP